jgi:hypothetical protein
MVNLVDYIVEFGLNFGHGILKDIKEEKEIHKLLQEFIEKQHKINEYSLLAEEIDFQGFCDYVSSNLVKDFENYLFAVNYKDRESTKETIIKKAFHYTHAANEPAKQKVIKLVSFIADILREFYIKNISRSDLFVKNLIADDVRSVVKESERNIISEFSQANERVSANSILSIDNNIHLMRQEGFNEVESNLNTFLNCIGSEHILYPYYRNSFEMKEGKLRLISEPLSFDSIIKYPPKMKCIGSIKMGNQYLDEFNADVIDYANRHQLPIKLSIVEAKKLLGDIVDPLQHEAEELIGEELVIPPKPFPAAFPCSIIIDGEVEFEYILLRTEEILEDSTYIISNKEQKDFPFRIHICINIVGNKTDFNIRTENPSNKDMLHYVQFMKKVSCGGNIVIRALSIGKNIMEGKLNYYKYKSGFKTIDDEISFLEKVVSLEDYFKKTMVLPNEIYVDDYEAICYMANLIRGEGYRGNWTGVSFDFILSDDLKNKIISTEESLYSSSYIAYSDILLYGEKYQFTIRRTYECGKIKNLERLKKKAEVLDVGDKIKMEYIPNDGTGFFVDNLYDEASNEIIES